MIDQQKELSVAIVGAGYMAAEHIRALNDRSDVKLVGIASRTRTRAEKLAREQGIHEVFDTVPEMLARTRPDIVVIAVSELSVLSLCTEAFRFPGVFLLEKPAGHTLDESAEIVRMANLEQRKVYVSLNRRFYQVTREVLSGLNDSIEDKRVITVQDQEDPLIALECGRPRPVVDNWHYANSIHLVDYFTLFARGAVVAVNSNRFTLGDHEFLVSAEIVYDSGDIGIYQALWNRPGPWSVSVSTSGEVWQLRPLEKGSLTRRGNRTPVELIESPLDVEFKPGLRRIADEIVAAARGETTDLPTVDEALHSMKLVSMIYEA